MIVTGVLFCIPTNQSVSTKVATTRRHPKNVQRGKVSRLFDNVSQDDNVRSGTPSPLSSSEVEEILSLLCSLLTTHTRHPQMLRIITTFFSAVRD